MGTHAGIVFPFLQVMEYEKLLHLKAENRRLELEGLSLTLCNSQ